MQLLIHAIDTYFWSFLYIQPVATQKEQRTHFIDTL